MSLCVYTLSLSPLGEDFVSPRYLVEKPRYLNEVMNEGGRHSISSTESCFRRGPRERDLMEEDVRKRGQGEGKSDEKSVSKFCCSLILI